MSCRSPSDNLDPAGRAFLPSANRVLSTTKAAEDLGGNVVGMEPWSEAELESAFSGNGIADRLLMLERGQRAEV